ncbi:MAG: Stf0 family sulfotransferase [Pseudomonadota bacterium]
MTFERPFSAPILAPLARPGAHERRMRELFGGDAESVEPVSTPLLLIAFTNRSGSSLFGELLVQSGAFAGGGEFLNGDVMEKMRQETQAQSLGAHITALARRMVKPGQAFALKASWDQLAMLARARVPELFGRVRVIHVFRDDAVAQAVSLSIAHQTGRWSAQQAEGGEPHYDEAQLLSILETQAAENARIRAVCSAMGWPRMLVAYEALVADPAHHVSQSQRFCGLEPRPYAPRPTNHRKQAGQRNDLFAERLHAALRDRVLGAP